MVRHMHTHSLGRQGNTFSQKCGELFAEIIPQAGNWIEIPFCPHSLSYLGCYAFSRTQLLLFSKGIFSLFNLVMILQNFCFVVTVVTIYSGSCFMHLLFIQSQNCQDTAFTSALHLFLLSQWYFEYLIILPVCLPLTKCLNQQKVETDRKSDLLEQRYAISNIWGENGIKFQKHER